MGAICAGIKRDGGRCTQSVKAGESFCWNHDPGRQDARRRAASRAGSSKPNRELAEIKGEIKNVINGVLAGELKTSVGAVSLQGFNTLLRACEIQRRTADLGDLLERLSELEKRADRLRGA